MFVNVKTTTTTTILFLFRTHGKRSFPFWGGSLTRPRDVREQIVLFFSFFRAPDLRRERRWDPAIRTRGLAQSVHWSLDGQTALSS